MATKQTTVDFILEQLSSVDAVSARKMFGEYALYCDGRVIALICNDTLFMKITDSGKQFVGEYYQEGNAYPGAKTSMQIAEEQLEDSSWLCELVRITAANLPRPVKK